ncbi:endoribonuclease Dicer-like isoform X1 [Schistocerca americana]|uniref:endoribonuclease Dicer-like isoform X1 n=1 Tax=Schistocerca americana TaxID=7009 RepID=UPI001F4FEE88|nr:endoribonuclease Dicer-like isoform X1 [Schistocerca americana]XP_046998794.1 endoribonuclease Dicer-like isoform X1 [Schistocerca americana]XP_046998795.1 endoribonuclease Dicer-like isoform X1 [Schistocerca americana]
MDTAPEKMQVAPRRYQEELLKRCLNENTILYLPTGSGKTFIAVMFIKEIMKECCVKYGRGKKLAVFVVNQVALAQQQTDYVSRHTEMNVGCYIGIMNVDFWDKAKWNEEFQKNQVLVMTAQILCNIIVHNILDVNRICVVVFDECHAATGNHPMKQAAENILKLHINPRLLGLSGSLINGDCKVSRVVKCLKDLEDTFKCKISTAEESLLPEVRRYSTNPEEEIHHYGVQVTDSFTKNIEGLLTQCQNLIMVSKVTAPMPGKSKTLLGLIPMSDDMKQNKELKNILENVKYQIEDLGLYGGYVAANMYITVLTKLARRAGTADALDLITVIKENLTEVRDGMKRQIMVLTEPREQIHRFSSNKFMMFVSLIEKIFRDLSEAEQSRQGNNNVLVFVQRRASARTLSALLQILSESDPRLRTMKPDCVVGYGAQQSNEATEMHRRTNEDAILRFRKMETNLLVATDVLEEGIDIPVCNTVIMFDPPNSCRSYIQSKGRARHKTSSYHIFVSTSDQKFLGKFNMYKAVGHEISKVLRPGAINVEADMVDGEAEDECVEWHTPCGSHAILKGPYAIQLVNIYSCKLPHDRYTNLAPLWYLLLRGGKCVCFVQLPVNSVLKVSIEGEPQKNKRLAKQSAAIEAVKRLHECGELDDDMVPRPSEYIVYHEKLFPYLTKEPIGGSSPQQGSRQRKQLYVKRCPLMYSDCRPKELQITYLHIIEIEANYPKPPEDSDDMILYDMFNKEEHFGILSSKEIPQDFLFPLYSSEGKLKVTVRNTHKLYTLSKEEICHCEEFHQFIFRKVLNIVKPFMCVDQERRDHSYLIVPVRKSENGVLQIAWNTVNRTRNASTNEEFKLEQTGESSKFPTFSVFVQQSSSGKRKFYFLEEGPGDGNCDTSVDGDFLNRCPTVSMKEALMISTDLNCLKQNRRQKKNAQKRRSYFNPELCDIIPLSAALCLKIHLLPSVLHKLTVLAAAYELCQMVPISEGSVLDYEMPENACDIQLLNSDFGGCGLTLNDVVQALTAASCDDLFNSETLETLGDSFLKFAVSLFLFIHYKSHHEGTLSSIKMKVVSNWHFYNVAKGKDIGSKLQIHRFVPDETWVPPGFTVPQPVRRKFLSEHIAPEYLKKLNLSEVEHSVDQLVGMRNSWNLATPNNSELFIGVQTVSDKALADALEALTGVYLKAYGLSGAIALLNSLGVLPAKKASPHILFERPPERPLLQESLPHQYLDFHLGDTEELEETLNYRFKDRGFLLQALTHPSWSDNRITDCYQRLEFLGDAILDFLVTSYIYDKCQKLSPGKITVLRAALVNNSTFAAFSVRIGLQKYCKYRSSELFYNIDAFVKYQQENNHEITDEVMCSGDDSCDDHTTVIPAPKVLGDLFESVAAAIYLDSGKCLKTVWSAYYRIMEKELVKYCM